MDNLEEHLRKEAGKFKIVPSEKVWGEIEDHLKHSTKKFPYQYYVLLIIFITGTAIFFFKYNLFDQSIYPKKNQLSIKGQKDRTIENPNIKSNDLSSGSTNRSIPGRGTMETKTQRDIQNNYTIVSTPRNSIRNEALGKSNNDLLENETTVKSSNRPIHLEVINEGFMAIAPAVIESLKPGLKDLQFKSDNRNYQPQINYLVNIGMNLSYPAGTKYRSFIKPGLSLNTGMSIKYNINYLLALSVGLGYEKTSYFLGAVNMNPETIYLNTKNGTQPQTANYRLNNESKQHNIIQQFCLPFSFQYKIFYNNFGSSLTALTGVELSRVKAPGYLIKSESSDRLFSNAMVINKYNNSALLGIYYTKKLGRKIGWMAGYHVKYQTGNTFKSEYNLSEHLMNHSLNFGVLF